MTISYDSNADVLYLTFFQAERVSYLESDGGILRIDERTQQIAGITIPFFREKVGTDRRLEIAETGGAPFWRASHK